MAQGSITWDLRVRRGQPHLADRSARPASGPRPDACWNRRMLISPEEINLPPSIAVTRVIGRKTRGLPVTSATSLEHPGPGVRVRRVTTTSRIRRLGRRPGRRPTCPQMRDENPGRSPGSRHLWPSCPEKSSSPNVGLHGGSAERSVSLYVGLRLCSACGHGTDSALSGSDPVRRGRDQRDTTAICPPLAAFATSLHPATLPDRGAPVRRIVDGLSSMAARIVSTRLRAYSRPASHKRPCVLISPVSDAWLGG